MMFGVIGTLIVAGLLIGVFIVVLALSSFVKGIFAQSVPTDEEYGEVQLSTECVDANDNFDFG